MSLYFDTLTLYNFRNHHDATVHLSPHITILYGPNASGKTNTIEALQLLTAGSSFRKPSPRELIAQGAEASRIEGVLKGDERILDVQLDISAGKKTFKRNAKKCNSYEMSYLLPSILFSPDDLTFIKGSSSQRRRDLDMFAAQVSKGYNEVLRAYSKAIEQRNRLLKDAAVDHNLLDAWDEYLIKHGATLILARRNLIRRLASKTADIYKRISGGESLKCTYIPSGIHSVDGLDIDTCAKQLEQALKQARSEDLRLRHTSIGPHRDDVHFELEDMEAKLFCSQGQQRSIVLAWKMAQVLVCEEVLEQKPLLLLDDVMSELDEKRRAEILNFIQEDMQTVITTTNLEYFTRDMLENSKVIPYGKDV